MMTEPNTEQSLLDIVDTLRKANTIAITTHIRPDGDAAGSSLGLCRILRDAGKSATVLDLGPTPDRYLFLIEDGECSTADNYDLAAADCIVVLDSGAIDRVPAFAAEWKDRVPVINLDHHISNDNFGQLNHVDTTASSVGEMVCLLALAANLPINAKAAEALWVAIVTDTGRFSYSNTTPRTMQMAALLLETGIHTANINHAIYNAMPLRQLQLQGRALQHLVTHEDGKVAVVTLSKDDYTELGCTPADAEDVVNLPRSLTGVGIAVFLYEIPDSEDTKVSLRTTDDYDAAEFCQTLGGGGHARAAGCSVTAKLPEAADIIIEKIHARWFT
jgi:phosphoesterase RecJ-like protein